MILLIALFIILLVSFSVTLYKYILMRKQRRYSSRMYLLGGGVIFIFINLINVLLVLISSKADTSIIGAIGHLTSLGIYAISILMPILIIEAIFLLVSNIVLIIKEGFRPRNMLGILFDIFIALAAYLVLYFSNLSGSFQYVVIMSIIDNIVAYLTLYYILIFNSVVASSYMAVKHIPEFNQDYIIILGCRVKKDKTLSRLLEDRVNGAIEFAKKQYKYTKKRIIFIPSGGKGIDEPISEALAMKNYLLSKGINENCIILEDKSTNTYENIYNSYNLINNKNANIVIATTNYHLFRSLSISRKFSPKISGISGKTKWYFYPNGFLREFIAIINTDRIIHIIIVISLSLIYGILTFLAYI